MIHNDRGLRVSGEPVRVHVNRGESEEYFRGYNEGWDDYEEGRIHNAVRHAPQEDPWRRAYRRGYDEGWRDAMEGQRW